MIDKHRSQKTDDNNNQAKDNVAESVKLTVIVQEVIFLLVKKYDIPQFAV